MSDDLITITDMFCPNNPRNHAVFGRIETASKGTGNTLRGLTRSHTSDMEGLSWSLPENAQQNARTVPNAELNSPMKIAIVGQEAELSGRTARTAEQIAAVSSMMNKNRRSAFSLHATSATSAAGQKLQLATVLSASSTKTMTTGQVNGADFSAPDATKQSACSAITSTCCRPRSTIFRTLRALFYSTTNPTRRGKNGAKTNRNAVTPPAARDIGTVAIASLS